MLVLKYLNIDLREWPRYCTYVIQKYILLGTHIFGVPMWFKSKFEWNNFNILIINTVQVLLSYV